jgi:tetratricopeptide (TPR) repeat protein
MLIVFIFALLSKENSLVFPLLLLSYHWIFKKRLDFKSIAPFVFVTALYIVSRIFFIQVYPVKTTTTLFQRIPGFFYALCNYINLLIFPHDLHMEYGMKLFHFSNPVAITGIVLLSVSIAIIFMVKETNKIIAFSLAWFIVGLLPMSNLCPINAYMAEHWLYLPSIGFFSVLAYLTYVLFKNNKIASVILVLSLTYFYSVLTIKQNNYWQEPISFFKRTLHYAPDSYNVYINMAVAYTDIGQTKEAIAAYKQAIEIAPKKAKAYSNLGGLYAKIGNNQEAERFIKRAIELDPNYIAAYLNLATIYRNTGKIEDAIAAYKQVAKIEPGNAKAYYSLGEISKNGGAVWNRGADH